MSDKIFDMVRAYLSAETLGERDRIADEMVKILAPRLRRYIHSRKPRGDEDDVLQNALVSIFKYLRGFEGKDSETFWGWCYAVTRNKILNSFSGSQTELHTHIDPQLLRQALAEREAAGGLSPADWADLQDAIDLIKASDAPCAHYLWDRIYVGLSFCEIGKELGITAEAATMRYTRCLQLAVNILKEKATLCAKKIE